MNKQIVILSRVAAYASLILGIIHLAYTLVLVGETAQMDASLRGTFLYMFIATGLACVLAGLVMLFSVSDKMRTNPASKYFFIFSAIFILLLGIGAPIAMSDNPFGYLMLLLGVYSMVIAVLSLKKTQ
jgi:FtsH-binding integral membrane protein